MWKLHDMELMESYHIVEFTETIRAQRNSKEIIEILGTTSGHQGIRRVHRI